MSKAFFVTGTDTNVGKTWASLALIKWWQLQGLQVAAMKPVAAGCQRIDGGWVNEDALLLQAACSQHWPYETINPYAFDVAVSPHVACGDVEIDLLVIRNNLLQLCQTSDVVLVEGAGGWLSPLSAQLDNKTLAQALELPVILVVGMRLGCINHALLSLQAIQASGLNCVGWLAVELEHQMPAFSANINYLTQKLEAPYLGCLSYMPQPVMQDVLDYFQIKNKVILT